jgi:hypothetical protein
MRVRAIVSKVVGCRTKDKTDAFLELSVYRREVQDV